jgi:hypothetical protein
MNNSALFLAGIILGALSWAICPLVSESFEPFDTGTGFIIGQLVMVIFVSFIGWSKNVKAVILSVAGLYVGQNTYAFIFGTSEAKAWAILLLFTSIFLCLLPLVSGLIARSINVYLQRHTKSI